MDAPLYLTQEELSALFSAIYDRDMAALRKHKAELEDQLASSWRDFPLPVKVLDKKPEP